MREKRQQQQGGVSPTPLRQEPLLTPKNWNDWW
jgi:hypothetical protein